MYVLRNRQDLIFRHGYYPFRRSIVTTDNAVLTPPPTDASRERRYPSRKSYLFSEYKDILVQADPFFVVQYPSMPVVELSRIRARLELEANLKMKVVKTGIMKRALKEDGHPLSPMAVLFHAPIAILIPKTLKMSPNEDIFNVSLKKFDEIIGKDKRFYILGARIEQSIIGFSDIKAYFSLGPKKKLQEQLLGLLESPLHELIHSLNSPSQTLVQSLEHHVNSRENSS